MLSGGLLNAGMGYLEYSEVTEAMDLSVPSRVQSSPARKLAIAGRWKVLAGKDAIRKYARLSAADRRAIVEILRDTKTDLPAYFR